jgi:cytochrome c-type biogenesis protein CcmF
VLLAACFVILWGTLSPTLTGFISGSKVTIGASWYNSVAVPIGLFLLFLAGVGPLLPWRATSFKSIRRNFALPLIAFCLTLFACQAMGLRVWANGTFDRSSFYALLGVLAWNSVDR